MDFSRHDYLTPENILAMVLPRIGDVSVRKLHMGFYHALIQEFLEAMSLHTLFKEKRENVPMPDDLRHILSRGTFNVKELYGYCGDLCDDGQMTKIWHKKNYYTEGGRVVAKNRQDGSNDPFVDQSRRHYLRQPISQQLIRNDRSSARLTYFYNIENGVLMLSSNCKAQFEMLHIRSSDIGSNLEDTPYIPQIFRTACTHYVCEAAASAIMAVDADPKRYQYLQQLYERKLDRDGFNGSWHAAANVISRMSKGEKDDYKEYLNRWRYL